MKLLGIITARGGSKGIPGKNIKELAGKPLIAYTIEAAKASGIFDRLILSTDDKEIADFVNRQGVEVPFLRPKELARDDTPTLPVIQHAVGWLKENEGYSPDYVAILQPTAPFRQARHLKEAFKKLVSTGADSVIGVTEIPGHFSPYWAVLADEQGLGTLFNGEPIRARIPRRQDFPQQAYANNGAIYMFKTELLFNSNEPNFYGEKVAVYPMEAKYSVNLDQPEDWEVAERTLRKLRAEEKI